MSAEASIQLPPDISAIPTVRLMLRRALPPLGHDDSALYFGAVTEILANAVAAHEELPGIPIRIEVSLRSRPEVTVIDRGGGFDPDRSPSVNASMGRGNGLVIARSACPDMTIESSPNGTTVRLPFGPGPTR